MLPEQGKRERTSGEPHRDTARMDDFEVIRERKDVMAALAALADRYRALNYEMRTRETLRWMMAP